METEWNTDDDTRPDPAPALAAAPDGGLDAALAVRDVPEGVPPAAGEPGADDGSVAEEELHRSAVDAVDRLLDEVELTLARLDDGTYGRCEACGATIDDERLARLPIERTCGGCDEVDAGSTPSEPLEPAPL